jgi:hypothetical protein
MYHEHTQERQENRWFLGFHSGPISPSLPPPAMFCWLTCLLTVSNPFMLSPETLYIKAGRVQGPPYFSILKWNRAGV